MFFLTEIFRDEIGEELKEDFRKAWEESVKKYGHIFSGVIPPKQNKLRSQKRTDSKKPQFRENQGCLFT